MSISSKFFVVNECLLFVVIPLVFVLIFVLWKLDSKLKEVSKAGSSGE